MFEIAILTDCSANAAIRNDINMMFCVSPVYLIIMKLVGLSVALLSQLAYN